MQRCRKEGREEPHMQGATAHWVYTLHAPFLIIISEKWRRERRAAEGQGKPDELSWEQEKDAQAPRGHVFQAAAGYQPKDRFINL